MKPESWSRVEKVQCSAAALCYDLWPQINSVLREADTLVDETKISSRDIEMQFSMSASVPITKGLQNLLLPQLRTLPPYGAN